MTSPFTSSAPDYEHPIDMLYACHDRIKDRCDLLLRLADHVAGSGYDEQAQQAAANVLRYFDTAGEHHHHDEEEDLFPKLESGEAAELVARLRADHEQMRALWRAVREPLQSIAEGRSAPLERGLLERFGAVYRAHIELEENELLPLARRVLDSQALRAIGTSMARRRGVERAA